MLTSWFVHSFQPNSHQSAIHASVEGKGGLIQEAELDLRKPAPKPGYPPPPGNIGLQQDPTVLSTIISDSFMGMVLKRSEEVMEALLVNRFHLRGLDNLLSFKSLQPKTKPNHKPSPKPRYPPPSESPLANNKARPAPKGYPPSPTTPLADVYQEQHNPAKINGLETM